MSRHPGLPRHICRCCWHRCRAARRALRTGAPADRREPRRRTRFVRSQAGPLSQQPASGRRRARLAASHHHWLSTQTSPVR